MARQARIEYENALHHVRSRGNNGQAIFLDDGDRTHFLSLLAEAVRAPLRTKDTALLGMTLSRAG